MAKKKTKKKEFSKPKFIQPSREPIRKIQLAQEKLEESRRSFATQHQTGMQNIPKERREKYVATIQSRRKKEGELTKELAQAKSEYKDKWKKEFEKGKASVKQQFKSWQKKPAVSKRILKKPGRITVDLRERPAHNILGERNIYFQKELDKARENLYFK